MYLDLAATTKPKKEVIDAMMPYLTEKWYNPSSLYSSGVDVKKDIEAARKTIADFIGAQPEEIYFTSGASEANNWAIRGFCDKYLGDYYSYPQIITTKLEHKSIMNLVNSRVFRADIHFCDNDEYGVVDYEKLSNLIKFIESEPYEPILVTIQHANNEIGTIQDIKKISDLVHEYGGILHTDATQSFGKIRIDVKEMGIDMMSVSGHKLGCPKGIGFLYIKNGVEIEPLIYGAQEREMRGGTENVAGIIGLAKAVELCDIKSENLMNLIGKRNYFIDILKDKFGCKLNGHSYRRLPNNINVTFSQNITGESLLYTLDMSDIKISVGSACNSLSIEPSYVLKAIKLNKNQVMKTVRFTIDNTITYEEIDKVIKEIEKAIMLITI